MSLLRVLVVACAWTCIAAQAGSNPAQPKKPAPTKAPTKTPPAKIPPAPAHPNLLVDVSQELINAVMSRPVDDRRKVRDFVRGSEVYGHSVSHGLLTIELAPSSDKAALDFVVRGQALSNTISLYDPVKIYSSTVVHYEVRKRIFVEACGLSGLYPTGKAKAHAHLNKMTDFQDEDDSVIAKTAKEDFLMELDETNRFASRRATWKQNMEYERDFAPELVKANRTFLDGLTQIQKSGFDLDRLMFGTTCKHLGVRAWLGTPSQKRPVSTPPVSDPSADFTLRLHENVINDTAQKMLARKSYTLEEILQGGIDVYGIFAAAGNAKFDPKAAGQFIPSLLKLYGIGPLTVTFAADRPVAVVFADQGLVVTIRGARFTAAGLEYPGMNIILSYRFEKGKNTVTLVRNSAVQIVPADGTGTGEKENAIRARLEKIFNLAPDRITIPTANLPGELAKAGPLVLTHAETRDGWLHLAWKRAVPGPMLLQSRLK